MQSVFNTALLARLRRQTTKSMQGLAIGAGGHTDRGRYSDQNIDLQVCEPPPPPLVADDPNDSPDPDDNNAPDVDLLPPEMPANWWEEALLLGDRDAMVSGQDVKLVFRRVEQRLADRATATGPSRPSRCVTVARDALNEGPDSGQHSKRTCVTTLGQLHAAVVEAFGTEEWSEFTRLYHESIGIRPRRKQPPPAEPDGRPAVPLVPLPADAPKLEAGLHRALPAMPPQVAAFLLHVPRDPPAWRHQESEGERAERQALENLGAWTG